MDKKQLMRDLQDKNVSVRKAALETITDDDILEGRISRQEIDVCLKVL